MTTYIEDWIDNPSIKNLCNSTYSSQSVLKCDSEIEEDLNLFHYNWSTYNSLIKWINKNYQLPELGIYQSWNPSVKSLLDDQIVSSFINIDEISFEDPFINPRPIKTFKLKARIVSKSKGVPKIFPID